jgi:hypothetical protein
VFGEPNATFCGADSYHFVEALVPPHVCSDTWLGLQEEYLDVSYSSLINPRVGVSHELAAAAA